MAIIRHTSERPLPPRWQRVVELLKERPHTITELATALEVTTKTARTYLSAVAREMDVQAAGSYGSTRYWIEPNEQTK